MTNLKHGKDLSEHLKNVALKEEMEKRTAACQTEIMEVLKKHNCDLDAIMMVGRAGCVPQITIVANKT